MSGTPKITMKTPPFLTKTGDSKHLYRPRSRWNVTLAMSALKRITDSSRTSREVRKVPTRDSCTEAIESVDGTDWSWCLNRNLPPDLNDLIAGEAKEVANMDGVALHHSEEPFLPGG
jgi:hypothetical protein